jgi:dTDP-4-amino-4,6-dideoxygalactose transaminase
MPTRILCDGRDIQLEKMRVPLSKPYATEEHSEAVKNVLQSGKFINGPEISEFEKGFSRFIGCRYAVATSSGTSALHLALLAVGIGQADEVVTVSQTFIATLNSIWYTGAKPKLADIDARYYVMDPSELRRLLSKRTRAILPVHLFGHPVDMDPLREMAHENDLAIIEDAAQAHGSRYKNRPVGTLGDVACFSFYPSKNLTVCGDGGMLVTNNEEIFEKARILRDHGRTEKYSSSEVGYNYRLSEIASALGRVSLKYLHKWNDDRRAIAAIYARNLPDNVVVPTEAEWAHHVYHMFAVRSKSRDRLANHLAQNGVQTGIHYPIPCHLQPVYAKMEETCRLEKTEQLAKEILSLPIFPGMTEEEVEYVAEQVRAFH